MESHQVELYTKMKMESHLNLPSPLTKVETTWSRAGGVEIWLKRDDLIHPIISGNKWRKLSGILNANADAQYSKIVTFGGAYSNHILATACACSILGIPSEGIVRGEEIKNKNAVLLLCEAYGMRLTFVSREQYQLRCRQQGLSNQVLYIPEGGACMQGTIGCESILEEVDITEFAQVYVACGTGTTIAGMAKTLFKNNPNSTKLFGIQVLKGDGYIQKELSEQFGIHNATILDQYHCGGYAKSTPELNEFIRDFIQQTGVLLDPIYTGKLMFGLKKEMEKGLIAAGTKLLAIHTGGLTGWFGKSANLFKV